MGAAVDNEGSTSRPTKRPGTEEIDLSVVFKPPPPCLAI